MSTHDRRVQVLTVVCILLAACAFAAEASLKGNVILDGKITTFKYGYAWAETGSSNSDFVLKLLFSEKAQASPQSGLEIIPIAVKVEVWLASPNSVSFGSSIVSTEGITSIMSTGDRIVLTSFDTIQVAGRIFHRTDDHSWDIQFSLPLLEVKNAEQLKAIPLGEPLPSDGSAVWPAFQSYANALKSGDPGTIRKFTTSEFGKIFSMPQMRILLFEGKDSFHKDIEMLSGFSTASSATLFVKPVGSDDGSEMGIVKLVLVNNEWKVSADVFTKFY